MRNIKVLAALFVAAILALSCIKDDTLAYNVITMAKVTGENSVVTDAGIQFDIVDKTCEGSIAGYDRVLIVCNILNRVSDNRYKVRLTQFTAPLVKNPVKTSSLAAPGQGLGEDPVLVTSAWVSGGYLNVGFTVYILDEEKHHTMNLEFDDTAPADTLRFTMRHDDGVATPLEGYDENTPSGSAFCSFPINDLYPEGVNTMPIKLSWTWDKPAYDKGVASKTSL